MAWLGYPRSIPPTFENKLLAINKDLEKLPGVSTVVLDKDELLLHTYIHTYILYWLVPTGLFRVKGFSEIAVVIAT